MTLHKRIGDAVLYRGDCLTILPSLSGFGVDMVLTDPPYGTTQCKWDSIIDFDNMWLGLRGVVRDGAAIVMTAQQPFTSALVMSNPGQFRQSLVWCKNKPSGHLNANRRHLTKHEDVILFCSGQPTYNQQRTTGHRPANFSKRAAQSDCYNHAAPTKYAGGNTDRCPTTLLDFPVVNNDGTNGGRFHPTQKPIELMKYLICTYTNEGDTVLDFAMGSGSTGVACAITGRKFIGIELDDGCFSVAADRIRNTTSRSLFDLTQMEES